MRSLLEEPEDAEEVTDKSYDDRNTETAYNFDVRMEGIETGRVAPGERAKDIEDDDLMDTSESYQGEPDEANDEYQEADLDFQALMSGVETGNKVRDKYPLIKYLER